MSELTTPMYEPTTPIAQLSNAEFAAFREFARARHANTPPPLTPPTRKLVQFEKHRLARLLLEKKYEALALYEPLPLADKFHRCNALWRLVTGANRAGKSCAAYACDARAFTGCDPYHKFPKRNGRALIVGLKLDHIALSYRTMFCPGAFKLIKDEKTKMYRSVRYDPADPTSLLPYDEAHKEKWIDAPPLIPRRCHYTPAWEDKNKDVPRVIKFKNGWRVLWLSALGEPEQGEHYNLVHFEEEMPNTIFYVEGHRGLTRLSETYEQRPKGIWSATSQVQNIELAELRTKAELDPESDFVQQFVFLIEENPYVSKKAREEFKSGLSEEDQLTRYHGIPASQVRRVYPNFKPDSESDDGTGHGCEPFEIDPAKFTRYAYVDPSVRHCATLLIAVDPENKYLTIYDAFDINGATARMWAVEMKKRQNGHCFEKIICDQQMGKESLAAREKMTVASEYWAAVREVDLQVRQAGTLNGFFPSCNDVDARTQALLKMMEIRGSGPHIGTCKLRIMRGLDPNLCKQVRRAQTDPRNPKKRYRDKKLNTDFLDDLEYMAADNPQFMPPQKIKDPAVRTTYEIFQERQSLLKKKRRLLQRRDVGFAVHSIPSN